MLATTLGLLLYLAATVPIVGWAVGGHCFFRGGLLLAVSSSLASLIGARLIGTPPLVMGVLLGLTLFLSAVLALAGAMIRVFQLLKP